MITSIELQVISKILTSDNKDEVDELLTFDSSFYSVFKEHIEFILNHREEYGNVPDVFTFQSTFPDITLVPVNESLEFLKSELTRNKQHILLVSMFNKIKDLGAGDVTEAWEYIQAQSEYALQLDSNNPLDIVKDAKKRADEIIELNKLSRIPTGFKEIDKLIYGGFDQREELVLLLARTNSGKAQPLTSHVLTPKGWKQMGELQLGDVVVGKNNDNGHVIKIFPQGVKDYYKVYFSDGSVVECCDDHLWEVARTSDRCRATCEILKHEILTTKELRTSENHDYSVDLSSPIEFQTDFDESVELEGELLGYFLGSPELQCDLLDNNLSFYTNLSEGQIYNKLKDYGIFSTSESFIPAKYLTAPVHVRQALLNGLMISNGFHKLSDSWYMLQSQSTQLIKDFVELARSLGMLVRQENETTIVFQDTQEEFVHDFDKCKVITSIEYAGKTECQCILLDNKSHTYITDGYTVTHNSWVCVKMMESAQANGFPSLMYSPEMSGAAIGTRFDTWRGHFLNSQLYQGKYDEDYLEYLENLSKEETPAFVIEDKDAQSNEVNVPFIEGFVKKHHIKLCIIDGLSYMADSKKSDTDYVKYKNLCLGLFKISKKYQCVMVISMQANRETKNVKDDKGEEFPNLYNVEGSDVPARIATKAFSIRQIFDRHVLDIRLEKSRMSNNQKPVLSYAWDINNGTVRYLPSDDDTLNDTLQSSSVDINSVLGGSSNVVQADVKESTASEDLDWDEDDVEF